MASKRLGYLHVWYDPEISGLESKVDVIVVKGRKRPIVFLGDNLGSLVVQEAVLWTVFDQNYSAAGEAILPEEIGRKFMLREIEIPYENSNSGANLLQQEQRANSFTTRPPPIIRLSPSPSGTLPHPFKLGFDEYAAEHNREHSLDMPLPRPPESRIRDLRNSKSEFQSQMPASTPAEPKDSPRINPFTGEPIKRLTRHSTGTAQWPTPPTYNDLAESPSTMSFNARSHAEERNQDPTHEYYHMPLLGEIPRVDARYIRPEASASRQTISHSDKEAYFVLFAAEMQKLITCVTGDRQVSIRSDQAEEESYPSTKTQSYRALEFLLDQSMTTDLELQSCCDALEAALEQGLTVSELIVLESKVDLGALLHHSIQRGQVQLTRSLLEFVAKSKTPHKALSVMRAAHFHAVRAIAATVLSLPTSNIPDLQVWQALGHRGKVSRLFVEMDMSGSESPKEYNFLFRKLFGLAESKANDYQISLHPWEIPEMIKGWTQGPAVSYQDITANLRSKLFNTVTISGSDTSFQAMTGEQYLIYHWNNHGIEVADCVIEAALLASGTLDGASGALSNDGPAKTVIRWNDMGFENSDTLAYAMPSHLCLFIQGVPTPMARAVQDIVGWLCQTFRPIEAGHTTGVQLSRTAQEVRFESSSDGHGYGYVVFSLQPLMPLVISRANCWMPLFERGVVAERKDSRDPSGLEGIEMSFELMTSLAAVETYHHVQYNSDTGGLILLGFFTALIPILLHDSGVFQWHFEYTDENILRAEDLVSTQCPWAFVNDSADFAGKRCVVGMWPQANIMLGVEGTRLDFEDSGLPHRSTVLRPNGLEVTAALGLSGGPVQGIFQATRTYEHQVTRQRFTRPDSYVRALDHLSQAVALVYDYKTHIAWLVPQTSLLLHLCHAYYARLSNIKGQPDPIPWAKPSTDGASAATAAFRGSGDIVVSDAGDHDQLLLRQLLVSLSSSLQVTQDTRLLPKKIFRWTKEVYFSQLQDQILEPDDGSALRVLDPAEWPSIKAWLEITKKVDGLLVCRNLDQAIALVGPSCSPPNQSPQANTNIITNNMNTNNTTTTTTTTTQMQLSTHLATCSSCAKVPEGRGYLVAHAWCLQNVLKRPSPIASKNMATWIQNGKPFDVHLHASNESIWAHPEKVLQSFAKPERGSVCNKTGGHTVEGAVVFGKYGEESLGEWLRKVALSP
ncbi:hypothetical protein D6C89_09435 [Aureobasidium pullulans]|nr:hypothetical protein D6C89_09435 [Aureobasidium pullulans]